MFEILLPQPVVEGFPLQIQSTASWSSKLFIGTADGSILVYEVEDEPSFTITLAEVSKGFSKKAIDSLVVLPKSKSLAVLSDSTLVVCDYGSLSVTSPMPKTRGCSTIQAWRPVHETLPSINDMFAAVIRRTIVVFAVSQYEEIRLASIPSSLFWTSENDIVAPNGTSALHIDLRDDTLVTPYILTETSDGGHFFITVHTSVFRFDPRAGVSKRVFLWSAPPSHVVHQDYYLAGLIQFKVEVRSIRSGQTLQIIQLPECSAMLASQLLFATSTKNVWRLLPLDFEDQIEELVAENRYDDALKFIEELEFAGEEDKASNITKVRALQAHYMFADEHKYQEALDILENLNASPLDVLDLMPALLDDDTDLSTMEWDRGAVEAIAGYLSRERARLSKYRARLPHPDSKLALARPVHQTTAPSAERDDFHLSTLEGLSYDDVIHLSQLVDTSLLKSYVLLNSPLLGSLVRVENFCDLAITEELLKTAKKDAALLDFYSSKRLHSKALAYLSSSPNLDAADEQIVSYLQRLKLEESAELIFKHVEPVVKHNPALGLTVFTENYNEVPVDYRHRIFDFLRGQPPPLATQYLEHVVFQLKDSTRSFHTDLAKRYLSEYALHKSDAEDSNISSKLVRLLEYSNSYDPEALLQSLPNDGMWQVRAVVYGRLKKHRDALEIHVKRLHSYEGARLYCERHYNPTDPQSRNIFTILFELCMLSTDRTTEQNLHFLAMYASKINGSIALRFLQPTMPLTALEEYLSTSLDSLANSKNAGLIQLAILRAERAQLQEHLMHLQTQRVEIADDNMCRICLKRISTAMFTHFADGTTAHAYCVT
ncbi:vacuolar sorting protein 39 domain 2-domain-containing protein [Entophlyctis helioformis]|nr:vacuolar sorting protein 39 domain 2-domain-containing protein [Entophlyctis helioformis]